MNIMLGIYHNNIIINININHIIKIMLVIHHNNLKIINAVIEYNIV